MFLILKSIRKIKIRSSTWNGVYYIKKILCN